MLTTLRASQGEYSVSLLDLNVCFYKVLSVISFILWKLYFPNKELDFIKAGNRGKVILYSFMKTTTTKIIYLSTG